MNATLWLSCIHSGCNGDKRGNKKSIYCSKCWLTVANKILSWGPIQSYRTWSSLSDREKAILSSLCSWYHGFLKLSLLETFWCRIVTKILHQLTSLVLLDYRRIANIIVTNCESQSVTIEARRLEPAVTSSVCRGALPWSGFSFFPTTEGSSYQELSYEWSNADVATSLETGAAILKKKSECNSYSMHYYRSKEKRKRIWGSLGNQLLYWQCIFTFKY